MTHDELRDQVATMVGAYAGGAEDAPLTSRGVADKILELVFNAGKMPTSVAKSDQILTGGKPPAHPVANEIKREIARRIAEGLPPGVGFCLITFTFDAGGVDYASNADRRDMVRMLEELLKGWKAKRMGDGA